MVEMAEDSAVEMVEMAKDSAAEMVVVEGMGQPKYF